MEATMEFDTDTLGLAASAFAAAFAYLTARASLKARSENRPQHTLQTATSRNR
jgi:hypothetical protein